MKALCKLSLIIGALFVLFGLISLFAGGVSMLGAASLISGSLLAGSGLISLTLLSRPHN